MFCRGVVEYWCHKNQSSGECLCSPDGVDVFKMFLLYCQTYCQTAAVWSGACKLVHDAAVAVLVDFAILQKAEDREA